MILWPLNLPFHWTCFTRAKAKNGNHALRSQLEERNITIPTGRRKAASVSLFTSLLEGKQSCCKVEFNVLFSGSLLNCWGFWAGPYPIAYWNIPTISRPNIVDIWRGLQTHEVNFRKFEENYLYKGGKSLIWVVALSMPVPPRKFLVSQSTPRRALPLSPII